MAGADAGAAVAKARRKLLKVTARLAAPGLGAAERARLTLKMQAYLARVDQQARGWAGACGGRSVGWPVAGTQCTPYRPDSRPTPAPDGRFILACSFGRPVSAPLRAIAPDRRRNRCAPTHCRGAGAPGGPGPEV